MTVISSKIQLNTRGNGEVIDITDRVAAAVRAAGLKDGIATLFCPSSTSALTTIEYESGAIADLQRLFDEIANPNRPYQHNARWDDGNGHAHVRAALLKADLTVPFVQGRLTLGAWQQIIYLDFDNRPRRRELVVQMLGE